MTKTQTLSIAVALVIVGGILGYWIHPKASAPAAGATSGTVGGTSSTAKIAAINMAPISVSATSTSLYNGDDSDRIVTDAFVTCSGVATAKGLTSAGVDAWRWYAATSSVAAPTTSIANSLLAAMNISVATSSTEGYTATTTYSNVFARRWNAGTYLIFETNATSSAAACTAGVHYVAS